MMERERDGGGSLPHSLSINNLFQVHVHVYVTQFWEKDTLAQKLKIELLTVQDSGFFCEQNGTCAMVI